MHCQKTSVWASSRPLLAQFKFQHHVPLFIFTFIFVVSCLTQRVPNFTNNHIINSLRIPNCFYKSQTPKKKWKWQRTKSRDWIFDPDEKGGWETRTQRRELFPDAWHFCWLLTDFFYSVFPIQFGLFRPIRIMTGGLHSLKLLNIKIWQGTVFENLLTLTDAIFFNQT